MAFQWKRFQFFESDLVADGNDPSNAQTCNLFQDGFVPTCSASGRGSLLFGDGRGVIKQLNRDLSETLRFQAYESDVMHMQQLKRGNILVTIGNDAGEQNTAIKIWRMDVKGDVEGAPQMARAIKLFSQKFPPVPVTSFTVLEDLSQLAIGLGNGAVMLFDGNLIRDRNVRQTLIQGQGDTVVSVHFREPDAPSTTGSSTSASQKTPPPVSLFVVTTRSVATIYTKLPGGKYPRDEIDSENGCEELGGCCMNDEKRLVVATKDAVFFYEAEEKREAYGFEGNKKLCAWFNGYLVLVNENLKNIEANAAAVSGVDGGAGGVKRKLAKTDTLTIYDLRNKFIAYTSKFESCAFVVSEFSSLFLITQDKKFYQLSEHDLQSKMETLFKKNLYQIAISLASNSSKDRSYVIDIFQRYGDHLYSKGDFDGAIAQYLETIKYVEPSYVIRKFLDAQRIHNLTRYLEALHEKGRANTDHTTLLLNCYTRLKDVSKLDEFIRQSEKGDGKVTFDVVTAINVCRQANYYTHALYLAKQHQQHDLYLKIQIEDTGDIRAALDYIASLPFAQTQRFMKQYGNKLVNAFPAETTQVLINLCTGWTPMQMAATQESDKESTSKDGTHSAASTPHSTSASPSFSSPSPSSSTDRSNPAAFIHLFVEHPSELERFLSHFFEPQHSHILPQLATQYQQQQQDGAATGTGGRGGKDSRRLEKESKESKNSQTVVCNTLLELYLRQYAAFEKERAQKLAADGKSKERGEGKGAAPTDNPAYNKAYNFIKLCYGRYDADHALVLCKMYGFEKGIIHLYDKMKLYHEIVQYHMEHHQVNSLLHACQRHGDKVPNLWVQALSYFAAQPEPHEEQIQTVLQAIKLRKLLPPLMILQILSANPNKQLSVVKDYVISAMQEEQDFIKADQEEIQRFQTETQQMREEIHRLHTQPITFQGVKCHGCGTGLHLPAVHFLCMHSFHQHCVEGSDQECPKCSMQYRQVRGIRESMKNASTQHDRFFKRLEEEQDGFSVVADYFGRGIFEKTKNDATNSSARIGSP